MDSDIPMPLSQAYGNSSWRNLIGTHSVSGSSVPISCAMLTSTTNTSVSTGSTTFFQSIKSAFSNTHTATRPMDSVSIGSSTGSILNTTVSSNPLVVGHEALQV